MTNAQVCQGFHDDKKVEENCIRCIVVFYISLKLTNCEYCSKHDPAKR